jgi:spermidine/putrescine transport system ATP-binding protein
MFDLQCDHLSKNYAGFTAVDDVSVDIPRGSFFSILGPSGCGKTTLMRMIAGFETPASGDIRIKGKSVLADAPNKRNVKMVFQHLALFPMMNIGENVAYGLRCRGETRSEIVRKVASVLDRVGLPGVQEKQVSQLSGGQKQRVAIARCLVLEPDVLLLDEPLGALDLKLREHMKVELKQLQHQFDTTFLYITHDQSEALMMSDNVAVMNAGRFEQIGTPETLYHSPNTAFVAGFVGDSNRWTGRATGVAAGEVRIELPGGREVVAPTGDTSLRPGAQVELFVRPESIGLNVSHNPEDGLRNVLGGKVESFLFNGANSRVLVRTEIGDMIEIDCSIQNSQDRALAGSTVEVSWPVTAGLCFRKET